jgi:two-component system CheB/CheR fusion protein
MAEEHTQTRDPATVDLDFPSPKTADSAIVDPTADDTTPEPATSDPTGPEPDHETDRQVQPVDDELPPHLPFAVVGIGASAGGLEAFTAFFDAMPPDGGMAFVLVQHLPPDRESLIAEILQRHTAMPVAQVEDGMPVEPDHVYVIRPGHTMTIKDGHLHLGERLDKPRHSRPVDDFFKSLAEEQRERAIIVIMSGMGSNGSAGAQAVKAVGGLCIAQDPESALFPSMPRHLVDAGYADYILRPKDVPDVLLSYAGHPYARGARGMALLSASRDQQHLREIMAVLRTRTRQDFSGYKKPTVLRRVQRRMGLNRVTKIGDYAKILRQSPSEVTGLADDLLIHVTGFFRDPEAWEALRAQVILPLVASRESGSPVRAWVTACASGEEAYSLAMLLVEESERAGRHLDIKIFATDMAERTLQNARQGVYPGGIEAEIAPERLERFFQREDAVYRVRQELRERVVFAPQNVLQDPPFSRLDIVSCRNLLIYLEPDVQQRLLALLHFGLREGGTLFLGTSETVGGAEDQFEVVDKRARIFRRVGPTRHGSVDFPLPHALRGPGPGGMAIERRPNPRPSLAQVAQRTLLAHHTPAAVMVDRDGRVVYFHGDTRPYLGQPTGEPTSNVLEMAVDGVRAAVRTALQRATAAHAPATVLDGWVAADEGRRTRLAVTASPVVDKGVADYLMVSFEERGEGEVAAAAAGNGNGSGNGSSREVADELRRVRDELQSTIEELQTSNEELKASHEEVVSTNEELQSTNEELETSREEMQSLNEELSTVNSQLHAKMEEHQATSNDLTSLLASTDIAVLFLDTNFRIRRFTPPLRDLLDMIPSDVGRPVSDLARRFDDPDLLADARAVLERLVPAEREVSADGGRWYLRRITPYRTTDQRIDGVVVTFVDISARRAAEQGLRQGEARFRALVKATSHVLYRVSPDWAELLHLDGGGFLTDAEKPTRNWLQTYIPPDDQPAVAAAYREAVRKTEVYELEHRVRRVDGTVGWAWSRAVPVLGPDGRVAEWFGAATDITGRKATEAALRDSRQQTLALVRDVKDHAIFMLDPAGRVTTWNVGAERVTGYLEAEAVGQGMDLLMTPEDRAAGTAALTLRAAAADGRAVSERWHVRKDGTRYWAACVMTALRDPAGTLLGFAKLVRDDTDRRRADEVVRASEARLRTATAAAAMGFWEWDLDTDATRWDPQHNQLLGLPADQVIGTRRQFEAAVHPADRARVTEALTASVADQTDYVCEFRVVRPDGAVRWVAGFGRPVADAAGRVGRMIGSVVDVSDRKQIEADRADLLEREQAARAEAEAANNTKDQFLATLSHELRTPLSAILLWSKILSGRPVADPAQLKEGLAAIRGSAEAQKELIADLLDVARITSGQLRLHLRDVDLAGLVKDAVDAIGPTAEAKDVAVAVGADPDAEVGTVRADPDRLRQVVWNLLTNAVKFTPAGGRVDVRVARIDGHVEVRVADTGRGMDADFLPHAFDRFRQAGAPSTRTEGGLGLGLSIVKQLVELHGGTVRAESPGLGQGTTFVVRLPMPKVRRRAGTGRRAAADAGAADPALAGRSVLLVEDDPATRGAVTAVLRQAGLTVMAVDSAPAAWAALEQARPDVLVSDIGLPGEDGYALMARVRRHEAATGAAAVPSIALTAFARDRDRRQAAEAGFHQHVGKPVEPEQLLAAVRTAVAERADA